MAQISRRAVVFGLYWHRSGPPRNVSAIHPQTAWFRGLCG